MANWSYGIIALAGVLIASVGLPDTAWYGLALMAVAAAALAWARTGRQEPPSRAVWVGVAGIAVLCLWTFLSMLWALDPGDAWTEANRTALYTAVIALGVLAPLTEAGRRWWATAVLVGVGVVAAVLLLRSASAPALPSLFVEGRLSAPTGYANATACLFLLALWPAIDRACDGRATAVARVTAFIVASLLLIMAALTQSRGAVVGLGVGAVLFIVLARRPWLALIAFLCLCALTAGMWPAITDVANATSTEELVAAARYLRSSAAIALVAAAGLWCGAVALERHWKRPARRDFGLGRRVATAIVICGMVGVGVLAVQPSGWLQERWNDFKSSTYEDLEQREQRLGGSLASTRYDYYRVAIDDLRRSPLRGTGAGGFAESYLRQRRTRDAPEDPHSLPLAILAELGLVGFALFAAAAGALISAALRSLSDPRGGVSGFVCVGMAGSASWLAQATLDRIWEFAAPTALALAWLSLSATVRVAGAGPVSAGTGAARVLGVVVAAVAFASLTLAGAAETAVQRSDGEPLDRRLARLEFAARLNPVQGEPLIARGILLRRAKQHEQAELALREAITREPHNWLARFELGANQYERGDRTAAREQLTAARRLNPGQPIVEKAYAAVENRRKLDATALERQLSPVGRPAETRTLEMVEEPGFRLPSFKLPPGV